ncbi:CPBP family intramembrane metalloprotease [Streptococcus parasanguinis]|uniref:CPBP family intramembrane glutamic endopeptidase n=1 Tax=Streptococcus parasanguinis TaxID=1318 RepID=UPI001CBF6FBB|nr:type II CAAX endopeptidase family protein [Streptococcus parasanguinis]MBZ2079230.1 CPBP family intramembrane metalloprotease [Streptococcus parasanguinis]
MKYLKHMIALLCFHFIDMFVVVWMATNITAFFNGSFTFLYSIQLALECLLILGIILWLKREKILVTFTASKWKWAYLIYFLLDLLLRIMTIWISRAFQNYIVLVPNDLLPRLPDSVFLKGIGIVVFLDFAQSTVIYPILEELTCRAYMMNVFFKHSHLHLDVLVSALFFSVLHLVFVFRDPISFLLYFIGGVFFAEVYKKHRDLRLVILLHAFYNLLSYWKPIWIFVYNYIYWHFLV